MLILFLLAGCGQRGQRDQQGLQGQQDIREAPSIILSEGWKFKPGDSIDYSQPDLAGPGWVSIEAGKDWQDQGYPEYFGYAGYSVKTLIPSSLKNGWGKDTVKINLGCIAFYDQTYLNGHLLGQNNITAPDSAKPDPNFTKTFPGLFCFRCYKLAADDPSVAMVPVFLFGGIGNDLQKPLALVIIGGLTLGTFFTTWFIPLSYWYLIKLRKFGKRL